MTGGFDTQMNQQLRGWGGRKDLCMLHSVKGTQQGFHLGIALP